MWDGAVRGLQRKSFSPENKISVKFTDDSGMSEGAIDLGGPQREFLTLIMHYLANSQMFCSGIEEDKKVLNNFSKGQWVYPRKGIPSQAKIANIMQSDNNRILRSLVII